MKATLRMVTRWATLAWIAVVPAAALAGPATGVKPHSLFADHMVLQRDAAAVVWGTADAGGTVTVTVCGQRVSGVADADGRWLVELKPRPAGGPHTLTIAGAETITLKDVMFGDVWICSGQSNMEQGIGMCAGAKAEIAAANHPQIRLFLVPHKIASEPQRTVDAVWKVCSPKTVAENGWAGFSGAAYYFGRHLNRELKVPIGLVQTCWGGTIAEAWTSAKALKTMDDFRPVVEQFVADAAKRKAGTYSFDKAMGNWWAKNDPGSAKGANWATAGTDDAAWKTATQPRNWESGPAELRSFDGLVWLRRTVDVPAGWAGKDLLLELGPVDDRDTTFFNGTRVGGMGAWSTPRKYRVPGKCVRAGQNVLAVRVLDTGGGGGLCGQAGQMQLRRADGKGKALPLAGAWKYRVAAPLAKLSPAPVNQASSPNVVTVLYNGMIEPLLPLAVKGAIWYQGESNAGRAMQYRRLLPTMIADWRGRFRGGKFSFFIVQLANFMAKQTTPVQSGWAELREAQALTAANDPLVGQAIITDIGDARDIHPKNKQDVGKRLALSALAIAYGKDLVHSGPVFRAMTVAGGKARLTFDHVGSGLVARGGKLKGFAVAGADGKFVWADATIEGKTIVVSAPKVATPSAVRYNWANNPIGNLFNKEGLPAGPFRTDVPATK